MFRTLLNMTFSIWVGSYTKGPETQGLVPFSFSSSSLNAGTDDSTTITTPRLGPIVPSLANPTYLVWGHNGTRLYVVHEIGAPSDTHGSQVSAYAYDGKTLSLLNAVDSGGAGGCHVSLSLDEDLVFVSHYISGTLTAFGLDPVDHSIQARNTSTFVSPVPPSYAHVRQEMSHLHQLLPKPNSPYVYVCDLGTDAIYQLEMISMKKTNNQNQNLQWELRNIVQTHAGAGPRHMVFHPTLSRAYVTMELSNELVVYDVDSSSGHLSPLQVLSSSEFLATHPGAVEEQNLDQKAAAVRLDPSGQYVLVSNRDGRINSIQSFAIDPTSGLVTRVCEVDSGGQHPRDFIFVSPDMIVVANQLTNALTCFYFNVTDGKLTPVATSGETLVSISQPVAVLQSPPLLL